MKSSLRRAAAVALAAVMCLPVFSGCKDKAAGTKDGKTVIKVANWPAESSTSYNDMEKIRQEFMEKNPDVYIEKDTWGYEPQSFIMLAASNQLPTLTLIPFTEASKTKSDGYAADITDVMDKYGYLKGTNPSLLELLTDENGRIYGVPNSAYAQGLFINKSIFKKAGLVNDDGSIKIPSTYDELAQCGQIIREKTGCAGLVLPTIDNGGGWNFLNIAWSYGTDFLEKETDGSYKAIFGTQEFQNALKYVYDLKWKYNALQDDAAVNVNKAREIFCTNQAGMVFFEPESVASSAFTYEMNKDDIAGARMPEGPNGRYSQMGGNYWIIAAHSTAEQQDAAMRWLEFRGISPKVSDEIKKKWEISAKENYDKGHIVLSRSAFNMWVDPERIKAQNDVYKPYVNVNMKDYDDYFSFTNVIIRPEPEIASQELYSVLDKAVQEVITNKNANIETVAKQAVNDYQTNHLDKLK